MPAHPGRQGCHCGTVQVEGTAVRGVGVERGQSCLPELDQKGDMRQARLQNVCCVRRCPTGHACLSTAPRPPPGSCVTLWRPSTLVGLRLGLARPVWGPTASNTWKPGSWALASFHGSGWVSRPEATRKAATGFSGRPGPAAQIQVARPGQAGDTGRASLRPEPSGQKAWPVAGLRPGPGGTRGRGGACVAGPGLGGRMAAAARSPPR